MRGRERWREGGGGGRKGGRLLNTLVSLYPLGHTISPPSICARLKMILGLLYRQYYNHVEGES